MAEISTDSQILQDVTDELAWDAALDAAQITVSVKDGYVTLTGKLASLTEQWSAEQISQCVPGVRGVILHLVIVPPVFRGDDEIAAAARGVLSSMSCLAPDAVRARVDDAWIHLSGKVSREYQRQNALGAVRAFAGVRGITNEIQLEGDPPSSTLQNDIERALQRQFGDDARSIGVTVEGSYVLLSGRVRSSTQRDLAVRSVWNAAGVRSVIDGLTWNGESRPSLAA